MVNIYCVNVSGSYEGKPYKGTYEVRAESRREAEEITINELYMEVECIVVRKEGSTLNDRKGIRFLYTA